MGRSRCPGFLCDANPVQSCCRGTVPHGCPARKAGLEQKNLGLSRPVPCPSLDLSGNEIKIAIKKGNYALCLKLSKVENYCWEVGMDDWDIPDDEVRKKYSDCLG